MQTEATVFSPSTKALYDAHARDQATRKQSVDAGVSSVIDLYASEYEFRSDDGDHTPDENERALLEDFGQGLPDVLAEAGFKIARAA